MVFVFEASIPRFSLRFSDFLSAPSARAGPVGPGTWRATDFDRLKQFKKSFLHMKENSKTNKKRQLRSKLKSQYFPFNFAIEVPSF